MDLACVKNRLYKKEPSIIITEKQEEDLIKLLQDHNSGSMNLHRYYNILSKQILFGLDDLYDRYILIKNNVTPKDSASLISYVLRYGEEHGRRLYKEKLKKCTVTLEYCIEKYGPDGKEKFRAINESKKLDLKNFIRRYGEIEGRARYEEFWKNTSFGITEEKFIIKYGEEAGKIEWKKYLESIQGRYTLEYYIDRYGVNDGSTIYKTNVSNRVELMSKESFIKKLKDNGHSYDEIAEKINNRWNQTSLEAFIRRYGEMGKMKYENFIDNNKVNNPLCMAYYTANGFTIEEGIEILSEQQKLRQHNLRRSSKIALKVLLPIANMFKEEGIVSEFYMSTPSNKEYSISLTEEEYNISNNCIYFYDLTFLEINFIIEYHGKRFHNNNVDYSTTKLLSLDNFKNNFERDLFKKFIAEQRGFELFVIREWEFKNDMAVLFKFCVDKFNIGDKWMNLFL